MLDEHHPAHYLPHQTPMLLLEKVISVSEETAHCQVRVDSLGVLSPFLNQHGQLPSWYALELMAQTVGVWSGWHRHQEDKQVISLGMILSVHDLLCQTEVFKAGASLDIHVNLLMQDGQFGSFEGWIESEGVIIAQGRLNTIQPDETTLQQLFTQGQNV